MRTAVSNQHQKFRKKFTLPFHEVFLALLVSSYFFFCFFFLEMMPLVNCSCCAHITNFKVAWLPNSKCYLQQSNQSFMLRQWCPSLSKKTKSHITRWSHWLTDIYIWNMMKEKKFGPKMSTSTSILSNRQPSPLPTTKLMQESTRSK